MAFDIQKYFSSKGGNIEKTPEAIREAAQAILDSYKKYGNLSSNSSYVEWAKSALVQLDEYDKIKAGTRNAFDNHGEDLAAKRLDTAFGWITGAKQPTIGKKVWNGYKESLNELQKQITLERSNIANILDFSSGTISDEEKAKLTAKAEARQKELDEKIKLLEGYGVEPPKNDLVRTASGFIPKSEAGFSGQTNREQEPTIIRALPGGGFGIFGANSNQLLESGFATEADALRKQQERSGGSTPGDTVTAASQGLTYLDGATFQRLQALGLTENDLVRDGERIYLKAGITEETLKQRAQTGSAGAAQGSTTGPTGQPTDLPGALEAGVGQKEAAAKSANPDLVVTPEMRATWVQESLDELRSNRYYSEVIRNAEFDLGTSLNRLAEDTRLREFATAQDYKRNLEATQSSLQDRGLLYGGVRQAEEKNLADQTNLALTGQQAQLTRSLQDIGTSAERYFGSEYASQIAPNYGTVQDVGRVISGSPVYQAGSSRSVFDIVGGNYGSLPREINTEAQTRAGEKETAFRDATSIFA